MTNQLNKQIRSTPPRRDECANLTFINERDPVATIPKAVLTTPEKMAHIWLDPPL